MPPDLLPAWAVVDGSQVAIWLAWTPLVAAWARRHRPRRGRLARPLAAHLLLALVLAATAVGARWLLARWLDVTGAGLATFFLRYLHGDLLLYLLLATGLYAAEHQARARRREVRAARLRARVAAAEVEALRVQMEPAFVFGVLRSIRARVRSAPDEADHLVSVFGELLREMVGSLGVALVPLRDELESLDRYLAVVRVQLRGRLRVEVDAAPEALDALLPPFLLQPLFEAALGPHRERGSRRPRPRLRLRARAGGGRLRLELRHAPAGVPRDDALDGVRARLRAACGDAYRLRRAPIGARGEAIRVSLPLAFDAPEGALPARDEDAWSASPAR